MKKIVALVAVSLLVVFAYAQIRIASTAKPKPDLTAQYDSTQNYLFPGVQSIYAYKGQDLVFVHTSPFCYIHSKPSVDVLTTWRQPMLERFVNKTFHVDSVFEREGTLHTEYVLKLSELESGNVLYYLYANSKYDFPFLCVGYKTKYEQVHSQFDYYVRHNIKHWNKVDFETGEKIEWEPLTIWNYKEYIYDPHHGYAALYTNNNGQTIAIYNEEDVIMTELYNGLVSTYGESICLHALNGRIQKGMPDVLLTIAWGEPNKVDTDSYGVYWIYDNDIVRLENGKVKSWTSM